MNQGTVATIFEKVYGYSVNDLDESRGEEIKAPIVALRQSYKKNMPFTEYEEKQIRNAYMLAYFPYYSVLTYQLMKEKIIKHLDMHKKRLKIAYFAAGPGPEIYGSLRALQEEKYNKRIDIKILDYEKGWEGQRAVISKLLSQMEGVKLSALDHISGCDLRRNCRSSCSNWCQCDSSVFAADICFMNNCINHMADELNFANLINSKIASLNPGALFVIIDLKYQNVKNTLLALAQASIEVAEVISTNISNGVDEIRVDNILPSQIKKYIFDGSDQLIEKKKVQYYYMILQRKGEGK